MLQRAKRPAAIFCAVALAACAHEGSVPRGIFDGVLKFCQVVVMTAPVVNGLGRATASGLDGSFPIDASAFGD
jgi:hypothetical protein